MNIRCKPLPAVACFALLLSACKEEIPVKTPEPQGKVVELSNDKPELYEPVAKTSEDSSTDLRKVLPEPPPPPPVPPIPYPGPEPDPFPYPEPEPDWEIELPPPPMPDSSRSQVDPIDDFPEIRAEYPEGEKALMEFIKDNLNYPVMCKEMGIQGRVFVSFVIEKDGAVSTVKVVRGIHELLDKESVRVIKKMPNWKPAETRGRKVRSKMILPFNFRLD